MLRTNTVDGIRKELVCLAIVYNLFRNEMIAESIQRQLPVNRSGFTGAIQRLR